MDFGKWMWRGVLAMVILIVVIGGYKLTGQIFQARVTKAPVLATVSLLDGQVLVLDQLVMDQDLIAISSSEKDLQMTWDGLSAQARLVIDPATLPEVQRQGALYKWLVAVPKSETAGAEQRFCASLIDRASECYRFSRTPKVVVQPTDCCVPLQDTPSTPSLYPSARISVQPFDDSVLSFFVILEPNTEDIVHQADPRQLFIRLQVDGEPAVVSSDNDRLNGYPFIQAILPEGASVSVDAIDRSDGQDVVFDTQRIDALAVGVAPLKGSAPIVAPVSTLPTLDALSFNWRGTDKTLVDEEGRLATDQSPSGHDFSTTVFVQSQLKESVKVVIRLVDQSVSFSHSVAPGASDAVLVNVQRLSYGRHELLMNAVFSDGQKTADVVIPFDYQSAGILSNGKSLFGYWQWAAAGFLIFFGLLYGWLKLVVFRVRTAS